MGRNRDESLVTKEERLRLLLAHREAVNPDLLLTDCEVAAILNCSLGFLRIGRRDGRRKGRELSLPPHIVLFGKMVRYRYGDLIAWMKVNYHVSEYSVTPSIMQSGSDLMKETESPMEETPLKTSAQELPTLKGWKGQVLKALISHGIIKKQYTGTITLEIENGNIKSAKREEKL